MEQVSGYHDDAEPVYLDEDGKLICPNCGDGFLHHETVIVYDRGEDALANITHIGEPVIPTPENPSPRRHGLRVRCFCEHHSGKWDLLIFQHKGSTYIEWEEVEPRVDDDSDEVDVDALFEETPSQELVDMMKMHRRIAGLRFIDQEIGG